MDKIFTGNQDYTKTAFLNWRTSKSEDIGNMLILAEGFLCSAITMSKKCLSGNEDKKADVLIFPILNNANHGIELYLKSLIWTLNKLLNSDKKIEGSHNIQQMYQTVQSKVRKYKNNDWLSHFNEQSKELKDYIDEHFSLISDDSNKVNMDFSRYPITNDYENHFYIDRLDNVKIDLEKLVLRLEKIKQALDERASYFFYQELKGEW